MTPEQYKEVRRLMKKHSIFFEGPVEPVKWPSVHRVIFSNIRALGERKYIDYEEARKERSPKGSFGADVLDRAARITSIADKCLLERRNEAGWRLCLEPEIFARFQNDIACSQCRGRLWRSEVEVMIDNANKNGPLLEQRRQNRKDCSCPPSYRQSDGCGVAINPLFSDRAEELVYHDTLVVPDFSKKEHPDRVYGLRKTRVFEDALCCPSQARNIQPVRAVLRFSPFQDLGEPLLFPFLILEAKSKKGSDDWDSIEKQTAFPIRTLLKLQQELYQQANDQPNWRDGPLVWFLSNKGESWRVYGCFTNVADEGSNYRVVLLWKGSVRFRDEALQLLLIIDHIFDWARDSYRPSILRHVKSLSRPNSAGIMPDSDDSDIWSLRSPVENIAKASPREQTPDIIELSGTPEIFRTSRPPHLLDSPTGAFRHVSTIVSEFSALLITGDSANTVLQSFATEARAKLYARKALKALVGATKVVRLTGQSLGQLEHLWTGESEIPTNPVISAASFYTNIVVKIGLTADWHQVRHLCCFAVSEDGFGVLAQYSGLRHLPKPRVFSCQEDNLLDPFRILRSAPADFTLRASIKRLALVLQSLLGAGRGYQHRASRETAGNRGKRIGLAKIGYCHLVQDIVYEIYKRYKIGRREPSEAFIRRSTGSNEQSPKPQSTKTTFPFLSKLKYVANGIVVVVGHCENPKTDSSPNICVFTFSKNPGEQRRKMIKILEKVDSFDRAIYKTRRHGPKESVKSKESNMIDNRTTARKEFYKDLQELIAHLQREEGWYLHAIPAQRQLPLAKAIKQLVKPAPSDAQTRDSCFNAGSLQSPTSRFFKKHEEAWAILTRPGGLDYLCAHCIKVLLISGNSTVNKTVTIFAKSVQNWSPDLDDDLKTRFSVTRHPSQEQNVTRLLYAIMSEHGISGIRLLLLLKDLRKINAPEEDPPQISDSENID